MNQIKIKWKKIEKIEKLIMYKESLDNECNNCNLIKYQLENENICELCPIQKIRIEHKIL